MQTGMSPDRLLNRREVEAEFGITARFLEIAAVRGDGPEMVKIGRSVRYRIADIRNWIETRRVSSTSEIPGAGV